MVDFLAYKIYLIGTTIFIVVLSEVFYAYWFGRRYLRTRAELEALIRKAYDLDVKGRRRRRIVASIAARVNTLKTSVRRLVVIRMLYLLSIIVATITLHGVRTPFLAVDCCIPLFTVEVSGTCILSTAMFIAFTFLALLPLVQEDLIVITLYKHLNRRAREGY